MNWSDLIGRGYVVVRDFLSASQTETLVRDFSSGPAAQSYEMGFKPVGRRALQGLLPHLQAVLEQIRAATELEVDTIAPLTRSHYISTEIDQSRPTSTLHQDFDLFYALSREHFHYLNFWLPIIKPHPEQTNLSLISFERLGRQHPDLAEQARGGGGTRWPQLEELTETPHCKPGDLVLLRGDVIHKTQDRNTHRVAASIRACSSRSWLSLPAQPPEDPLVDCLRLCLEHYRQDRVTVNQFLQYSRGVRE